MVSKNRGWFNESYRHFLAAKGVKTRMYAYRPTISTRPRFAEGLQRRWDEARERFHSGDFLLRSKEARMRDRARERESLLEMQDQQRRWAGVVSNKPLTADEELRRQMIEAELKMSAPLRARLAQKKDEQFFERMMENLEDPEQLNVVKLERSIDAHEQGFASEPYFTREEDRLIGEIKRFVDFADTRADALERAGIASKFTEKDNRERVNSLRELAARYEKAKRLDVRREKYGTTSPLVRDEESLRFKFKEDGGSDLEFNPARVRLREEFEGKVKLPLQDKSIPKPWTETKREWTSPLGSVKMQVRKNSPQAGYGGLRND